MPKWVYIPRREDEPLKFHPYQDAFWKARRLRTCKTCLELFLTGGMPLEMAQEKAEFASPPHHVCPTCKTRGLRKYHRLLMMSGRRGGKTEAGAIAAVEEACVPNTIGWCCAPTNPKLHRYILPALQRLIPDSWVESWSSEFNDIRLKNGSLIHLQTLEDPDQGRGQGLHWLWIDEICELSETHWNVIRPSLTEHRGVAFFTSSPRSYDWVWEGFYHKAEEGTPGYWAARYATSENPIISAEELADAKSSMPDTMFRQEYLADFVIYTGAVYGGAVDPQVLRTPEQIKEIIPEWPRIEPWRQVILGVDTGADHPFGAVKLVSTEKGLVVVGEYLERHRSFIEHANSMKMLANSVKAKWAINKNERQPMIELAQHGIFCQPSENDVVSGTERVKSWLHMKQLWFVDLQPDGRGCPMTIRQMKAYRWAEDKAKDGSVRKEKVFKKDDELPDCLRYAVMTWPQLPKSVVVTDGKRDLSKLPDDMRMIIERMRKIDARKNEPDKGDEVGDFWG